MPITKSRLSRAEQANYLRCLKELQTGGCDLEIPGERLEDSCPLDIVVRRGPATVVVEGPNGGVYYAVHTGIIARQAHVTLIDCYMEAHWDADIILESFQQRQSIYRLGRLQYAAKEVLNDRIENSLRFDYRGQLVEGVILFSGIAPVPAHYSHRASAPFKLTFLDQFEQPISTEAELCVERMTQRKSAGVHPKSSLYEPCEDPCQARSGSLRMNKASILSRPSGVRDPA